MIENESNPAPESTPVELIEELTEITIIEPVGDDALLERTLLFLAEKALTARSTGEHKAANVHMDSIEQLAASWEELDR